jgi:hypothetical protein
MSKLWEVAVRVPEGREKDLMELLAANGFETYRAWPVNAEEGTEATPS